MVFRKVSPTLGIVLISLLLLAQRIHALEHFPKAGVPFVNSSSPYSNGDLPVLFRAGQCDLQIPSAKGGRGTVHCVQDDDWFANDTWSVVWLDQAFQPSSTCIGAQDASCATLGTANRPHTTLNAALAAALRDGADLAVKGSISVNTLVVPAGISLHGVASPLVEQHYPDQFEALGTMMGVSELVVLSHGENGIGSAPTVFSGFYFGGVDVSVHGNFDGGLWFSNNYFQSPSMEMYSTSGSIVFLENTVYFDTVSPLLTLGTSNLDSTNATLTVHAACNIMIGTGEFLSMYLSPFSSEKGSLYLDIHDNYIAETSFYVYDLSSDSSVNVHGRLSRNMGGNINWYNQFNPSAGKEGSQTVLHIGQNFLGTTYILHSNGGSSFFDVYENLFQAPALLSFSLNPYATSHLTFSDNFAQTTYNQIVSDAHASIVAERNTLISQSGIGATLIPFSVGNTGTQSLLSSTFLLELNNNRVYEESPKPYPTGALFVNTAADMTDCSLIAEARNNHISLTGGLAMAVSVGGYSVSNIFSMTSENNALYYGLTPVGTSSIAATDFGSSLSIQVRNNLVVANYGTNAILSAVSHYGGYSHVDVSHNTIIRDYVFMMMGVKKRAVNDGVGEKTISCGGGGGPPDKDDERRLIDHQKDRLTPSERKIVDGEVVISEPDKQMAFDRIDFGDCNAGIIGFYTGSNDKRRGLSRNAINSIALPYSLSAYGLDQLMLSGNFAYSASDNWILRPQNYYAVAITISSSFQTNVNSLLPIHYAYVGNAYGGEIVPNGARVALEVHADRNTIINTYASGPTVPPLSAAVNPTIFGNYGAAMALSVDHNVFTSYSINPPLAHDASYINAGVYNIMTSLEADVHVSVSYNTMEMFTDSVPAINAYSYTAAVSQNPVLSSLSLTGSDVYRLNYDCELRGNRFQAARDAAQTSTGAISLDSQVAASNAREIDLTSRVKVDDNRIGALAESNGDNFIFLDHTTTMSPSKNFGSSLHNEVSARGNYAEDGATATYLMIIQSTVNEPGVESTSHHEIAHNRAPPTISGQAFSTNLYRGSSSSLDTTSIHVHDNFLASAANNLPVYISSQYRVDDLRLENNQFTVHDGARRLVLADQGESVRIANNQVWSVQTQDAPLDIAFNIDNPNNGAGCNVTIDGNRFRNVNLTTAFQTLHEPISSPPSTTANAVRALDNTFFRSFNPGQFLTVDNNSGDDMCILVRGNSFPKASDIRAVNGLNGNVYVDSDTNNFAYAGSASGSNCYFP